MLSPKNLRLTSFSIKIKIKIKIKEKEKLCIPGTLYQGCTYPIT